MSASHQSKVASDARLILIALKSHDHHRYIVLTLIVKHPAEPYRLGTRSDQLQSFGGHDISADMHKRMAQDPSEVANTTYPLTLYSIRSIVCEHIFPNVDIAGCG
jgi:hypothetical protein